jgi:hypothetical protein
MIKKCYNINRRLYMKIYLLTIVIILLLSGCKSMQKDIDKEKLGKDKTEQKKEVDPQLDQKIAALDQLNDWFSYPVAQNRVQKGGNPIIVPYSRGSIYFEIYYDENEVKNYGYFDRKLRGDIKRKGQDVKEGLLYINPADKAALYYYPRKDGEFDVFKVRIKKEGDNSESVKPEAAKPEAPKSEAPKK